MSEEFEREVIKLLREMNARLEVIEAVAKDHISRIQRRDQAMEDLLPRPPRV